MKFNFISGKILLGLFLALWLGSAQAQTQKSDEVFSYTRMGKLSLKVVSNKLLIHFAETTTEAQRRAVFANAAGFLPSYDDQRIIAVGNRHFMIVPLEDGVQPGAKLDAFISQLEANPEIKDVAPVVRYEDGIEQGVYGQFYVKLKQGTSYTDLQQLAIEHKATIVQQYEFDNTAYLLAVDKNSRGNAIEVANAFHLSNKFEYAEPNYYIIMRPNSPFKRTPAEPETKSLKKEVQKTKGAKATVSDPLWPLQWAHVNPGPTAALTATYPGSTFVADADMDVDEAWDLSATRGAGIRVAIIDEGVQLNHPDLTVVPGFDSGNFPNNTLQGGPHDPAGAHGTNCAGIVAARANNGIGVAGVAYNATIVPVNIFSGAGAFPDVVARGINWAWRPDAGNADVLSNSYGGGTPSALVQDQIRLATTQGRAGKGAPALFSAGNGNVNPVAFPSRFPEAISVIATTMCDSRKMPGDCSNETWGSHFGIGGDIAAPGVNIYSTDITAGNGYVPGDYFATFNGTSSACPFSAGTMALVLSANPNLTEPQARRILEGTTDKVGGYVYNCNVPDQPASSWSVDLGYGRVNARKAVAAALGNFCAGTTSFTSNTGYFEDGSFLFNYTNNQDCRWIIQPNAAGRVTLTFQSFALAAGDVVEVYDGTGNNANLIASLTGTTIPAPVISNTGVMVVRLRSDGAGTAQGFQACWTADVPNGDFTASRSVVCLNLPVTYTATTTGTIVGYNWNFGAGATPATATSPGPHTVTYSTPGPKTVTLTLTGPGGNIVITKQNIVRVTGAPGTPETNQGFEAGLPGSWSVINDNNAGAGWVFVGYTNPALQLGGFAQSRNAAYFDNYNTNTVGAEDHIVLPPMSFVGYNNAELSFDVAHSPYVSLGTFNDRLRVQYSTDCGATWVTLYDRGGNALATAPGGTTEFFPTQCNQWRKDKVSLAALNGLSNVVIRFSNINDFGNNIFLDNIAVSRTGVPTNLTATASSPVAITLNWVNPTPNSGVLIERSAQPNANFVAIATTAPNATTFVDQPLGNSATFYYRIAAVKPNNEGITPYVGQCPPSATTQSAIITNLLTEDFNGCALPAGWARNTLAGNPAFDFWRFQAGALRGNTITAPFAGCYAYFDSDGVSNNGIAEDITLESPTINAAGQGQVFLAFDQYFRNGFGGDIAVEAFDGTNWIQVFRSTALQGSAGTGTIIPNSQNIDISAQVGNKTTGRIRFRWRGNWSWWWAVDNVRIYTPFNGPSNLTATANAAFTTGSLSWKDNSASETQFQVERSTVSATGPFTQIGTAAASAGANQLNDYFADNTINANGIFWYRVRAVSGAQNSDYSNVAVLNTLVAPINLTAIAASASAINLAWQYNATGALTGDNFIIERSTVAGSNFVQVGIAPIGDRTFTDNGLTSNTTYYYRVTVARGGFNSNPSNIASATTLVPAPTNVTAVSVADNQINVSWTDNAANEFGYRIERSLTANAGFALLQNVGPDVTVYEDATLVPDTRYYYRVAALNSAVPAGRAYGNDASAVTYPARPTDLVVNAVVANTTELQVNWTDNSTTELGFQIERSSNLSGPFAVVGNVGANVTQFRDATVAGRTQYYYRVRATRETGVFSRYSSVASGVSLPGSPTDLTAKSFQNKGVTLTWKDRSNSEIIFEVERSESQNGPFTRIAITQANVTTYLDTVGLAFSRYYYYRVRAIEPAGPTEYTNVARGMRVSQAPVGQLVLRGTPGNMSAMLNWDPLTDYNVKEYAVYSISLSSVQVMHGTTKGTSFTVTGLTNGTTYAFRIKALSDTGLESEFSNTVLITPSIVLADENDLLNQALKVYPNPTSGEFTLSFENNVTGNINIEITNVAGQVVYSKQVDGSKGTFTEPVNLGTSASGMYIISVQTEKGIYKRKISVTR